MKTYNTTHEFKKGQFVAYDGKIVIKNAIIDHMNVTSEMYRHNYVLDNVIFKGCIIRYCSFTNCIFKNVTFDHCDLRDADFKRVTIINKVVFVSSNIKDTKFSNASKSKCTFINCGYVPKFYTAEQSFYGYKYTRHHLLILEIPKGVLYFKSTSGKCRAEKAKVISILNIDGSYSGDTMCKSYIDDEFAYTIGEIVIPYKDFSIKHTGCASGIHFFMTIKEAIHFFYKCISVAI